MSYFCKIIPTNGNHLQYRTDKSSGLETFSVKILKQLISWTIWGVILLNLTLMGLAHLPAAQSFIGRKVAGAVQQKLGTQVSIGSVNLGFLNRIIIDDVTILDQQGKKMLRVSRLSAKIDVLPLTEGKISISSAQLFGAHLKLYKQHAKAKPNFQFVLDSLASKDTTSHTPLDLRINSFIMRRSSIAYDEYDKPKTPYRFSLAHIAVSELSAHINLWTLTDDSLNLNVKRLTFEEQSALKVKHLTFHLEAGKQKALLTNFKLQMPNSLLQTDTISAHYAFGKNGFNAETLTYSGAINDSHVTLSDLRGFEPSLKNFQKQIEITTYFNGTAHELTIPQLTIATEQRDIDIDVSGWVENWNQRPAWHLQMNNLTLSDATIDFISKNIYQLPQELTRLGNIQMNGTFDRDLQGETSLHSLVQTGAGEVSLQFNMAADQQFDGNVETEAFNLGQILDNEKLGEFATNVSIKGKWTDRQHPDMTAVGEVSRLEYNDYTYQNIVLNGSYQQSTIAGQLTIGDPNLTAQLEGEVADDVFAEENGKKKRIKLKGEVSHFSPSATKLTDKWGDAKFSTQLDADFTATNLNDATGNIRISSFTMTGADDGQPYFLNNLNIASGYDEGIHFVSLKSDFADAELKGTFDYGTLAQSITNIVGSKLPTLPGLPKQDNSTDNNFNLRLLMSKSDWLQRLLGIDLTLQHPLTLTARVNDNTREVYLDGDIPSFAYNGSWYSDGSIHVTTPADTLKCNVDVTKRMDNGQQMDITLLSHAIHNNLSASLAWDNHQENQRMSGQVNSVMQFYKNTDGKSEALIRIIPSHLILNNEKWSVEPAAILYHENHLVVDHFAIKQGQQHILIDGIASKRPNDMLAIDLNEVEVGYILDLVNFHSVEFSGKATGKAYVSSLFSDFAANARLDVHDFKFERGRMGTLHANVQWNQEEKQIDIDATADDGEDAQTIIKGFVSPPHNTIDLGIYARGTHIDFMHNFTSSFLSSITGNATGDLRLAGTLDNINLTGQLVVDGEASVTPLNTTYELRRDTVVMIPDEIELRHMVVYDKDGNPGILSGGIHHQHLTNLTFDLYVEADNLLAYDFQDFGESTFYGTVYASGDVAIQGRPREVTIDCNVTPQKNSVFVYNAANPDAISKQEFIEWGVEDEATAPSLSNLKENVNPERFADTDIYINFLVNTTPEATLRLLMDANTNDYITLNGDGVIRATFHNKGAFNMFGTYTVDHGTYDITIQNIIKKNFTFNPGGTIIFGGDPYNAALNLQAVYTVSGVSLSDLNIGNSFTNNSIRVNCLMNIGGQPNAPKVDFDLEMPNVNADEQQMVRSVINGQQEMNQQVVYLLGIGRFYNQGNNNSGTEQQDQTSLAMQSFLSGTLSTQINTLLGNIIKSDNWNFGANISTGNEGWHNAEYEGIINGRMLNNRLLLNGQFGYRDNATQANPSFIGDFDIQYLLYPNGNLALKVYNQTNDRYFTRSSLNTQGVGLIMKKDFNGIRDLFTTRKGSTKKQKKKRKKE